MKFLRLPPAGLALLGSLLSSGIGHGQAPVRILPLGDSITDGSAFDSPDGSGGYRGPLYNLLSGAGYNVDYIGSHTVNSGLLVEKEHEGHSGWRIDQLDTNMAGWLESYADPDVVLMHIGTNDFGQNFNTTTAIDRLDALILKIATLRPYAHIIVTNLMEREEPRNSNIQAQFNPFVEAVVDAHAAAGRRVTFLDMRAAVPLSDMPDQLHPDQTGYDKMAGAWLPAIQEVIGVDGDDAVPEVVSATGSTDHTHVTVKFSKPVADSAANLANFSIDGGLTISAAELDDSKRLVTLTTSEQTLSTTYTVSVNGVEDRLTPVPNSIAANSTATFEPAIPRGYHNHVPEAADYTLVQSVDLPAVANFRLIGVPYQIDNRAAIGPFDRVAYYLELQSANGQLKYLWASMDAFTDNVNQIGVPTHASGAVFQESVANLNVVSNVAGVTTGSGLTGNLEFWPTNYQEPNGAGVPGADGGTFDFGDTPTPGDYGSMQLHNAAAGETLFAFNHWGSETFMTGIDLGIGNQPGGSPDWTFSNNGGNYTVKTLQVLVRASGDVTPPTAVAATATFSRTRVIVTFSEPIVPSSVLATNFSLDQGVTVLNATLSDNRRDLILATTPQPVGPALTLTLGGVRDASPNANPIAPGSTIAVTGPALPPEIVANVGAAADGYQLVSSIELPDTGNFNAGSAAYRYDDRDATGAFNRIAYYLELQKPGQPSQFIWTAMDAFTVNRRKLGPPTIATGAVFQRTVGNLDVISNVAGVINGTGIATGNIEFWPNDYGGGNAAAVPGANGGTLDFGDTRNTTGNNYGSMQVHNHGAGQTLFAINHAGADNLTLDIGIGNQPSGQPDWTFAGNSGSYSKRILHALVLPGSTTPAGVASKVPESAGYQLLATVNLPGNGNLSGGAGAPGYAVDNRTEITSFSRVAYYLELKKTTDPVANYIWTSMDAFSAEAGKVCVPNTNSGAFFQQNVANLNVVSNVAGIVTGNGITTGNIEFWPSNYNGSNAAGVPGASGTAFDFGDGGAGTGSGYGSMQVHNHGAGQTLFAINNWGASNNTTNALCMGIGNNPTPVNNGIDWTFAENGPTINETRLLHIFVLPGNGDSIAPTISRAVPSTTLDRFSVIFSEPVADSSADPANFTVDGGVTVTGATLLPGNLEIALATTAQAPGTLYNVTVSGVRDRSTAGNPIAPASATSFTSYAPPAVFGNVSEIGGYDLVYQLAIPGASPRWNFNAIPYGIDEAKFGPRSFDRIAYLMELDGTWIYTSFDGFTGDVAKTGVPSTRVTATPFQQDVSNLNVATNVTSIYPDTALREGLGGGNIEFWGGNYTATNGLGVPGASNSAFDFGDTMTSGGHGSMQVHDHDAGRVLFAYNNWGANAGQVSDLGIGNRPSGEPDWTFGSNATSYTTKNLYVLVRPAAAGSSEAGPVLLSQPSSRSLASGASTTLSVQVAGSGPFYYQWRFEGVAIPGETRSWLEITGFGSAQAGGYDVVVTSAGGASTISRTATLVLDEPFLGWLDLNGIADAGDDGDQDGISALLEWFLGGDPAVPDSAILPAGSYDAGVFTYTFQMPAELGSVTWHAESGGGLVGWDIAVDGEDGVAIATGTESGGYIPVTVTFTGVAPPLFVRIVVNSPS
ncbi:GDSL-type esterase/lipase family protein [Luteolibacter marinus]|uniref:GDSL-type esterase/lipase family protein n=1 Tax=Luteolibacter marinus TaxID=2776705 RepID=UPI00186823EA|nr:GDSL-type esterase/lipase family protein [Luteolibacter marinus]